MTDMDAAHELATAFAALNEVVRLEPELPASLQRLAELAVTFVPGAHSAAITECPSGSGPYSLAGSDRTADEISQVQYRLDEGPGLTAARGSELVRVSDLRLADRWPRLAAAVTDSRVRGVLAGPLASKPNPMSLVLYSRTTDVFDAESLALFELFTAHARVLVQHAVAAERVIQLTEALQSSRQVATAVGIVMQANDINEPAAAGLLRLACRHLNRKVSDVAAEVIETGELPSTTVPSGQTGRSRVSPAYPVSSVSSSRPPQ